MTGSRGLHLRGALASAGASVALSLGFGGAAVADVSSLQQSICNQPQNSGNPLCATTTTTTTTTTTIPNPSGIGTITTTTTTTNTTLNSVTSSSVASLTPNQFNSADFIGYASGNSELDAAIRRLQRKRSEGGETNAALSRYAAADPKLVAAAPSNDIVVGPFSGFLAARGGILNGDDTATQRGFSGNTIGGQIGGDYRVTPALLLGGYFGYDHVESDFNASSGNSRADNYSGILYGNYYATEHLYVEGVAGYVYNGYSTVRNGFIQTQSAAGVPLAPVPFTATGNTGGNQWLGTLGAGYEYPLGAATLTPYARLNYVQTRINPYTESSTTVANQVAGSTITSLTSNLGVRASYAMGMSWGVLVPQVRGEYIHEFDGARQSTSSFVVDPTATALIIPGEVTHDYGKIGVSLTAVLPSGLLPYFDYEGLVGYQHFSQHIFTAGLRMEF
jgi:outer membrane lipase/esterase